VESHPTYSAARDAPTENFMPIVPCTCPAVLSNTGVPLMTLKAFPLAPPELAVETVAAFVPPSCVFSAG
jgi:hypothetical protein